MTIERIPIKTVSRGFQMVTQILYHQKIYILIYQMRKRIFLQNQESNKKDMSKIK